MSHLPDPLISARFKNIQGTVSSPVSKLDLAGYINQFGNLYFGDLKQQIFLDQYKVLKNQYIPQLIDSTFDNFTDRQSVQFYMHMLHEAQKVNTWRWPAMINHTKEFQWVNGNSRLFCTGMVNKKSIKLKYLVLQKFSLPGDFYLDNPVLVNNDSILHDCLNVDQTDDPWVPHCELILNYDINNKESLLLSRIRDRDDFTDHNTAGEQFLKDFLAWRARYGPRPTLQIYTNWPELVKNTHNAWDIKIVGGVDEIKRNIIFPAHLEAQSRWLHDFNKPPDNVHILTIVEPRHIDVAELLFWVNLDKTAFISSDWSFLLYRPNIEYSNKFIDVSQIDK